METLNVEPIHDRLVIKRIDLEAKTKGGIILGEVERDQETGYGRVVAVGKGKKLENNTVIDMTVQVGDIVAFNTRIPIRVSYRGQHFHQLRESDVFFRVLDTDIEEREYTTEGGEFQGQSAPKMMG